VFSVVCKRAHTGLFQTGFGGKIIAIRNSHKEPLTGGMMFFGFGSDFKVPFVSTEEKNLNLFIKDCHQ
jgi:hypothetical protein